jgi:hypothetical protein
MGKVGAKNAFFLQKCAENPPKNPPGQKWGGVGVCDSVDCDVTPQLPPNNPPGTPRGERVEAHSIIPCIQVPHPTTSQVAKSPPPESENSAMD